MLNIKFPWTSQSPVRPWIYGWREMQEDVEIIRQRCASGGHNRRRTRSKKEAGLWGWYAEVKNAFLLKSIANDVWTIPIDLCFSLVSRGRLRWWVASHGCQHSQILLSDNLVRASAESVQQIRSLLRFLLGALHPHDTCDAVEGRYLFLDRFMLHQLYHYNNEVLSVIVSLFDVFLK